MLRTRQGSRPCGRLPALGPGKDAPVGGGRAGEPGASARHQELLRRPRSKLTGHGVSGPRGTAEGPPAAKAGALGQMR